MLTRALDTRVAEAAQLRKALEVAKREAARSHAEMDELRQAGPHPNPGPDLDTGAVSDLQINLDLDTDSRR
jgi:hypothetical protein